MGIPNFGDKYDKEGVFTPHIFIEYARSLDGLQFECPSRIILVYSDKLLKHVQENYAHTSPDFSGKFLILENYDVGVIGQIGIGGPFTSTVMEELGALGATEFIIVGTAGGIAKDQGIADLVVVDRAIRDEGVSHHYLPPTKYVDASTSLVEEILQVLDNKDFSYHFGSSWTIDAPYRETAEEVIAYQNEGVRTVEMEAASIFAIAKYRGYHATALLVISDDLSDLEWNPQFHADKVKAKLRFVIDTVITS